MTKFWGGPRPPRPPARYGTEVFLEISQNSQENTCIRVSFLRDSFLKKTLWHRCFPVNFAKFLRTPFLQNTSGDCFQKYKRQRSLCVNLSRKTKNSLSTKLDDKQVSDNKMFWKKVKPFFSDNSVNFSKKALVEKNSIVVDRNKIANIMNNYFINITKTLTQHLINAKLIQKSLRTIFASKKTRETSPENIPGSFHFEQVSSNIVRKEIRNLNIKKSSTHGSIPASILKQCVDSYLPYLTIAINYS